MSKQEAKREKVTATSGDVLEVQISKLRCLFPECVSEGKIDFEKLKTTLGGASESDPGRFTFTWAGKDEAIGLLQTPSHGTLTPCPTESVNWDTTHHAFIEGDNLEVLKLLFKPYFGRVKLIYIDPPYNTGNDFIYPDNFTDPLKNYLIQTKQIDDDGNLATNKIDRTGRVHSGWLSMMYPRLFLARQLLKEDGVICVSIDDNEVHHLRLLMNEVFGEENFVAQLIWKSRQYPDARASTGISTDHEYILVYSRTEEFRFRGSERDESKFSNPDNDPRGPWMSRSILGLATAEQRPNLHYPIRDPKSGNQFDPPPETGWRYGKEKMTTLIDSGCILFPSDPNGRPREKKFRKDMTNEFIGFPSIIQDVFTAHGTAEIRDMFGYQAIDFPKPAALIQRLVEQTTANADIVLDFFAGSGTTGHAVLAQNLKDGHNRSFLLVQLQESTGKDDYATIAEVAKERLRRAVKQLQSAANAQLDWKEEEPPDLGFKVFKLTQPNIEQWAPEGDRDPDAYAAKLHLFDDPLVEGWKPENVLWELALREGFGLSTRYVEKNLANGNRVYAVTDPDKDPPQTITVCLDEEVRADLSKHYPLTVDSLLVCRDKALDDTAATNLALQCRLKTI